MVWVCLQENEHIYKELFSVIYTMVVILLDMCFQLKVTFVFFYSFIICNIYKNNSYSIQKKEEEGVCTYR